MAKRSKTIQIKKDKWDFLYGILMILFTGLIAYGAIVKIPTEIKESNPNFRNYTDVDPGSIGPRIPYLIYGKFILKNVEIEGANITIINSNTREQMNTMTNEHGEYVMDLSNFPHYFQFGDNLIISACVKKLCEKKEIIISGQKPGLRIDFQTS